MDRSARVSSCPPPGIAVFDKCSLRSPMECVKQSDLGHLAADADVGPRGAIGEVHIPDVQADDLREPEARAECEGVNKVSRGFPRVAARIALVSLSVRVGGLRWGMDTRVARRAG